MAQKKPARVNKGEKESTRKPTVMQRDLPAYTLEDALKVPKAIVDEYGGKPTRPIDVAHALNMMPTSSSFRMLCGAALAYGLTESSWNADRIPVSPLGKRIAMPTKEGDDEKALREAALKPRVIREFLKQYNGSKYPRQDIAYNILLGMGVPKADLKRAADLIEGVAESSGFFKKINDVRIVDLEGLRRLEEITFPFH